MMLLLACLLGSTPTPEHGRVVRDKDGDGYSVRTDCDDRREDVHPFADEVCDGVDNDCDGGVDLDAVDELYWLLDHDGDGYGAEPGVVPGSGVWACSAPIEGLYIVDGGAGYDCDDDDPAVHPSATEVSDDGVDSDCDGAD